MKQILSLALTLIIALAFTGCSSDYQDIAIKIHIPAGSTEQFVYSDEEISTNSNTLTIAADADFVDTEIILKPIEVTEENAYEPIILTSEAPVEIDIEKGAWFKVGVAIQNETDEDMIVNINVSNIIVRIE